MSRKTPPIAAAEAQVTAPEGPPNKRGKGGRPTTGQLAEQGELTGAKAALKDVQEAQPSQFQMRPSQRNWAREYDREERLVEQEEAEAILAPDATAVFRMGGRMCEPTTHSKWARDIILRAQVYGVRD